VPPLILAHFQVEHGEPEWSLLSTIVFALRGNFLPPFAVTGHTSRFAFLSWPVIRKALRQRRT
jgi:hypothetical protein